MYTVTFYSFKGGTGRTMAMANVAVELAAQGRTVLMVDFDLEAPGLDTFGVCKPRTETKGLVDFVADYLTNGGVPDVRQYVYRSEIADKLAGELWVMPAGLQGSDYDTRFKNIDWKYLYDEQEGFLLFEDLKEQWRKHLKPHYVLIDSRTGHTDVGGICTRQLPDAVVILFFPNEQNRRGLKSIVDGIRDEATGPLAKTIKMHFVMSNVPDLDDEEEILAANVERLRETLQYDELAAVVHHYNSLLLLNQAIFTLERPRSRLAKEYAQLTRAVRLGNLEDRESALEFLESTDRALRSRRPPSPTDLDDRLQEILSKHPQDGEILRFSARIRRRQRRWPEAVSLLDQAVAVGTIDSDILYSRAELHSVLGNPEAALADVYSTLRLPEVPSFDLQLAVRLLIELKGDLRAVTDSPVIRHLDDGGIRMIVRELESSVETLPFSQSLLSKLVDSELPQTTLQFVANELTLCLIGQGKFKEAIVSIHHRNANPDEMDIQDSFNLAMAQWADKQSLSLDLFSRVVSLHRQRQAQGRHTANYYQCIAFAFWAVGDLDNAFAQSKVAYEAIVRIQDGAFSCWSYLWVDARQFTKDVAAMDKMFNGQGSLPDFMVRAGLRFSMEVPKPTALQ